MANGFHSQVSPAPQALWSGFLRRIISGGIALGLLAVMSAGFLGGCAYQFGNAKRGIPGGYNRVAVPVFKNDTTEVGVETYFTSALIEEIERTRLAAVSGQSEAQVVLEGTVTGVDYVHGPQVTRSSSGFGRLPEGAVLTKEYRVVASVALRLRRKSDDKILWSGVFSGEQRYSAPQVQEAVANTVNPLYNHSARHQTIRGMARDMMSEAHNRMTENF